MQLLGSARERSPKHSRRKIGNCIRLTRRYPPARIPDCVASPVPLTAGASLGNPDGDRRRRNQIARTSWRHRDQGRSQLRHAGHRPRPTCALCFLRLAAQLKVSSITHLCRPLYSTIRDYSSRPWGQKGTLWKTRRISWDGMGDIRMSGSTLSGEAWDAVHDTWREFHVDLETGVVIGGAFPEELDR
jgi:hypothetical protein